MPAKNESSPPRTLDERREVAQDRLESNTQLWLATGSDGHGAHLIPVAYVWDGVSLVTATFERSRTTANIRSDPHARVALGSTADVVMIDAAAELVAVNDIDLSAATRYAQVSRDPRSVPGFTYIRLNPQRVQVWKGMHEFAGRTVMRNGSWLRQPVD